MARKLTVRLWDILAEQESDVLDYFNSINNKNNSAIKSIVDEVNQINIDMESKVTDVNYVHTDNNYTTVEKQKLQGIADNANNYVHPSTHNASMITQDASHRFATDIEKATWNSKANISDIPNVSNKLEISNIIAGTNITLDKVGNNVTINSTASGGGDYILPTASATVKGGIKVGSGLTMTGDVLSTTGGGGNVDLTQVSTNIVPTTNSTLNLGSPTNRFKTLYCDEAKLATNTLYIGDVPVLGTDNGNIMVKADPNQNLGVKTTGMGNLGIHSSNITEMLSDGVGGSVNVKAMGTNGTVNITSATGRIEMTAPTINMSGNTTTGNLTIGGNLTVQGTTTTVDSANLSVADNIIELNKGETGQGVSKLQAGIKIKRGDLQDQHIVFDEASDRWKVGEGTSLKNITTDDMIPTKLSQLTNDSGYLTTIPTHNHNELYYSKAEIDGKIPVIDVNKQYVDTQDTLLDGKITENTNKIGDLSTLTTTQKSNLVGAVNEIDGRIIGIGGSGKAINSIESITSSGFYTGVNVIGCPVQGAITIIADKFDDNFYTLYVRDNSVNGSVAIGTKNTGGWHWQTIATTNKTEISFPFNSGVVTKNGINTVSKINNIVYVNVSFGKSDNTDFTTDAFTIGTLPVGYRPKTNKIIPIFRHSGEWGVTGVSYAYLNSAGTLSINVAGIPYKVGNVDFSFIVD